MRDRWLEERLRRRETRVRLSLLMLAVRVLAVVAIVAGIFVLIFRVIL
ncbi:MAG: hypothetical protein QMD46_01435 [Methanomicrobiales archaeon]|nr:hypothetical protein [Methanomicrobiales archaeon]